MTALCDGAEALPGLTMALAPLKVAKRVASVDHAHRAAEAPAKLIMREQANWPAKPPRLLSAAKLKTTCDPVASNCAVAIAGPAFGVSSRSTEIARAPGDVTLARNGPLTVRFNR